MSASGAAASGLIAPQVRACSWQQVLSMPGGWFNDVAIAGGSAWAVGYQTPRGSNKTYPLIATWDGHRWSTTVGKGYGKNEDVITAPGGEVWVTGVRNDKPILQRFDGLQWTKAFREVTFANSQDPDVWMAEEGELVRVDRDGKETRLAPPASIDVSSLYEGFQFTADNRGHVWLDDSEASRFHFWDGSRWSARRYPGEVYLLYEMATRGPSDVWAVGNEVAHWDGRRWKEVIQGGDDQVLWDIDVTADRVLAVGQDWGQLNRHGVVAEWDGRRWRTSYFGRRSVSNRGCPACDISTVEAFNGVAFASPHEVWAVGYGDYANDMRGVAYRGTCR
jgi:hypothetical protein